MVKLAEIIVLAFIIGMSEATTSSRNRAQDSGADCVPMEEACKIGGTPCCEGGACEGNIFGDIDFRKHFDISEWRKCIPALPGLKRLNADTKKASMAEQIRESKNLKELDVRREAAARFQRATRCGGTPCEAVYRCCDSTCNIKPGCFPILPALPGLKRLDADTKKTSAAKQIRKSKNLKELHLRREAAAKFQRDPIPLCWGTACMDLPARCCDSLCNILPDCGDFPFYKTGAKHMPHSDETLLA